MCHIHAMWLMKMFDTNSSYTVHMPPIYRYPEARRKKVAMKTEPTGKSCLDFWFSQMKNSTKAAIIAFALASRSSKS